MACRQQENARNQEKRQPIVEWITSATSRDHAKADWACQQQELAAEAPQEKTGRPAAASAVNGIPAVAAILTDLTTQATLTSGWRETTKCRRIFFPNMS